MKHRFIDGEHIRNIKAHWGFHSRDECRCIPILETTMAHQSMQTCIDACNDCAVACDHCASACLQEQDVKSMARCIALDIDCAAICRTAAGFMSRGSELASAICAVCADICDACAEECERHDMDHCRECATACRRCADECRRMAGKAPAATRGKGASDATMRQ